MLSSRTLQPAARACVRRIRQILMDHLRPRDGVSLPSCRSAAAPLEGKTELDLNAIIQNVVTGLQSDTGGLVRYELNLDAGIGPVAMSQRDLEQIIKLLCIRSERSGGPGATIVVSTAYTTFTAQEKLNASPAEIGQYASITVNGVAELGNGQNVASNCEIVANRLLAAADFAAIENIAHMYEGSVGPMLGQSGGPVTIYLPTIDNATTRSRNRCVDICG